MESGLKFWSDNIGLLFNKQLHMIILWGVIFQYI